MHNCCCIVKNRICVGIFIKQLPRVCNVAPTRTEKLCWSETVCNKTRDLLTRIDWKFYVLERLWSWHVLVIDNDYDHGICWRSIVSMIMTCVGDQEWLWSWHVLAIKLIRSCGIVWCEIKGFQMVAYFGRWFLAVVFHMNLAESGDNGDYNMKTWRDEML